MVEFGKNLSKSRVENDAMDGRFQDHFGNKKFEAL